VADDPDRLPRLDEVADERDGVLVGPKRIGVPDSAGQHQRVVFANAHVVDRAVDLERVRLVVVVEALDPAFFERDEFSLPARLFDRLPRLRQFDLLNHVGREERDLLVGKIWHTGTLPTPRTG
jgi:hypothetical protein